MCLFSISLLAFTIWCIFYVRRDDENEKRFVNATISQPLDNYPQFAYDNNMLNHQVRQQPDRMSRGISRQTSHMKSMESVQSMKSSARSGYSYHARQRQEFEKRLLIEPRYIQDESGQVY